jgi:hypothetical protein
VVDLGYESLEKPRKQNPRRAFRQTRVRLALAPARGKGLLLRLQSDWLLETDDPSPRLVRLRLGGGAE